MSVVVEKERTFEHYLDLVKELRTPIIDRMQARDRCVFCGCSVLCNKEAKASKNYIYRLALDAHHNSITINVLHSLTNFQGFNIEFKNLQGGPKYVEMVSEGDQPFHRTNYDDSINLLDYATEHFKNLLKFYQKGIKSLHINGEVFGNFEFGVDHLNNLEELAISTVYMKHFLPKLKHPLKNLIIHGETSDGNIANFEQIYQTKNTVVFPYPRFNNEQLLRLSASTAKIEIGELTVENVYNFIRAWQNGTLGRRIEHYQWDGLTGSNFNCQELLRLLGEPAGYFLRLQHFTEPEKCAEITYNRFCGSLIFDVDN